MKTDREALWNDQAATDLDRVVRMRLENWGSWQKLLQQPRPNGYPNPQPMFREMKSEWNEEDADSRKNTPAPDVDDAERVEDMICMISKHNQSVIHRYFVLDQNTVRCSQKARISVRQFEKWLSQAIGQVAQLMMLEASEKIRKSA